MVVGVDVAQVVDEACAHQEHLVGGEKGDDSEGCDVSDVAVADLLFDLMHNLRPEDNIPCRKPVEQSLGVDGVEEEGAEQLVVAGGQDSHELSERPGPRGIDDVMDLEHDTEVLVDNTIVLFDVVHLSMEVEGKNISVLSSELGWNKRKLGGDLLIGIKTDDHTEAGAEGDVVVWSIDMSRVEDLIRSILDGMRGGHVHLVHPIQNLNLPVGSEVVLVQVRDGRAVGNPVECILGGLLQALLRGSIGLGSLVPPVGRG
mmetsp:Transcript_43704/g.138166  ORF Transcript_43704/g.138166 Transcript_43704/m.138166 type:complete len:258 (+) Transcript_43704:562-1335(+)